MSKTETALKLALEAFDYIEHNYMSLPAPATKAITAIRKALAQPEQKPVAKVVDWGVEGPRLQGLTNDWPRVGTLLYTAPPQRKPLTDEEIAELWDETVKYAPSEVRIKDFARVIEAKLKEKNT